MTTGELAKAKSQLDPALLLLVAVAIRLPAAGLSEIDWDESMFALVAREILHGRWPYSAVFDPKPIGLYLHYAAAMAIFGDNPIAVRLLGVVATTGGALIIRHLAIARLTLSRRWGMLLGIAYLFASIGFDGQAVYSEHLVNFYVLLSVWLLTGGGGESRPLLSGCAAATAVTINYLAAPLLVGMLAGCAIGFPLQDRRRRSRLLKSAGLYATGAIVAIALVHSPIFLFSDPAHYFALQLRFLARYRAQAAITATVAQFALVAAAFLPLIAAAAGLAWFQRQHELGENPSGATPPWPRVFACMSVGAAAAALASGYAYGHYFLLAVPPMLLLVGSLATCATREAARMCAAFVAATALMMSVPGLVVAAAGARNLLVLAVSGRVRDEPRQLAGIAAARVQAGSSIYTACAPLVLYQLLEARPATRFPMDLHTMNRQYASALGLDLDRELAAVFAKRPAMVVLGDYDHCWGVPQSSWQKVRNAVDLSGYEVFAKYDGYTFFARPVQRRTAESR